MHMPIGGRWSGGWGGVARRLASPLGCSIHGHEGPAQVYWSLVLGCRSRVQPQGLAGGWNATVESGGVLVGRRMILGFEISAIKDAGAASDSSCGHCRRRLTCG